MRLEQITSDALRETDGDRYLLSVCVAKRVAQLQNGANRSWRQKRPKNP